MLPKSGDAFCRLYNKDFNCKAKMGCRFPCPLAILRRADTPEYIDDAIRADLEGREGDIETYPWESCIEVISQPKVLVKACARMDELFGCQDAYGCTTTCPIGLLRECIAAYRDHGTPVGLGYRRAVWSVLSELDKAGIEDAFHSWGESWPEPTEVILERMNTT